ncbi:MAG: MaoC family dehydratase N-terminal domain-containing protein [Actinobacteria bacterium]|nr:MaoC family dehydratase N-terminal domain-containing protein [Actinomycetota bacterium]
MGHGEAVTSPGIVNSAKESTQVTAVAELAGLPLGSATAAYEERDAILYALAVGAGAEDLALVYERNLRVLPTYGLTLGLWAVEAVGRSGAYDPVKTLHVSQRLTVHRPLPAAGSFEMTASVASVWDKKVAALVEVAVASEYFEAVYGIWVPGAGEFGGERGPSAKGQEETRAADLHTHVPTGADQAVLYRLTGDLHPLHVDHQVAVAAGFDRPILHGLCVLGASVLGLARADGSDPAEVSELSARFAAPTYPGDKLEISGWRDGAGSSVRFTASRDGEAVLTGGDVRFGEVGR